jgi:Mn2+/Fe2+ NRAMP family transporter
VDLENVDPAFSFRIKRDKRIAFITIIVIIFGDFIMAAMVQASLNAGPVATEALYNAFIDNAFEIVGLIGGLIFFIGLFGFGFAIADVMDKNPLKSKEGS